MRIRTDNIDIDLRKHGRFTVTPEAIDWAIETYLPTSRHDLRQQIEQATGIDYSDVDTVFHLLAVLADMDAPSYLRAE